MKLPHSRHGPNATTQRATSTTCSAGVCQPVALTAANYPFRLVGYHQLAVTREKAIAVGTLELSHGRNSGLVETVNINGTGYASYETGTEATAVVATESNAFFLVDGLVHQLELSTGVDPFALLTLSQTADMPGFGRRS